LTWEREKGVAKAIKPWPEYRSPEGKREGTVVDCCNNAVCVVMH